MIHNYPAIRKALACFQWTDSKRPWGTKIQDLDLALSAALRELWIPDRTAVHLAFSGGVDSTTLLYRLLAEGFSVITHNIAVTDQHPDAIHARRVVFQAPGNVTGRTHIFQVVPQDKEASQQVYARPDRDRADNYYYLMREISRETKTVVCGDCVDELLGGYYSHLTGGEAEFIARLQRLVPDHLDALNAFSTHFGVEVFLPYGDPGFITACGAFSFPEMALGQERKRPLYALARYYGVPERILERRKFGLVQATEEGHNVAYPANPI